MIMDLDQDQKVSYEEPWVWGFLGVLRISRGFLGFLWDS